MVPRHPFNEMKPNSGCAAAELDRFSARILASEMEIARNRPWSSSRRSFVIDETRKPLPHIARFVEMIGYAQRAAAHGKCEAAKIRHDGEHGFVGHIVADKNRNAAFEWRMRHQFADTGCLVKAGMLDLADAFSRQ